MSADDITNAILELERAWNAKASEAQLNEHIGHCARLARRAIAEPAVDKSPVLQGAPVDKAANLQGHADDETTVRAMAALETMAEIWAAKTDQRSFIARAFSQTKPAAAASVLGLVKCAFMEGAYDGRTSLQTEPPLAPAKP